MQKRGQQTLFIGLGIIIVVVVLLVLYVQSSVQDQYFNNLAEQSLSSKEIGSAVQTYMDTCLESIIESAILHISQRGGYFTPPEPSADLSGRKIAYFFHSRQNLVPSNTIVERELSTYIENELPFCVQNLWVFWLEGFDTTLGEITATTVIRKEDVSVTINYPVSIQKGGIQKQFTQFSGSVPSRLHTILSGARILIADQMADPENLCLSCIFNFNTEHNLVTNVYNMRDNQLLFETIDSQVKVKNTPLYFYFANRYT